MNAVAQAFVVVTAAVHATAFAWESIFFKQPRVHSGVFKIRTQDVPAAHLWAFNVGFYNLCLAAGLAASLVAYHTGHETVALTLAVYLCISVVILGIVLFISDRMALSRPRGAGVIGAISQTLPPAVVLVALFY